MKHPCYTCFTTNQIRKECFIVESITSILNNINSFSKSSFKFTKLIEPLLLLKKVPDHIYDALNSVDFIYHLNEASNHISWLNDYINDNVSKSLLKEVNRLKNHKPTDSTIPYADFTIDAPPVFKREPAVQLNFDDILTDSINSGKPLKPVKRRNPDTFSFQGVCPFCGAPKEYIYDNTKGRGQFMCKACSNTFTVKTSVSGQTGIYCPHCGCKLSPHHDRKGYIVYYCPSKKCSYYRNNKDKFDKGGGDDLKTSSNQYRFRYHYRDFKFNLENLRETSNSLEAPVNLSRIHFDHNVLGLALTYYVNYGLSSRKTSLILREVHGLKISHQTIINYATSVSVAVKPLIDNFAYDLCSTLSGDETYIKVRGKNHYVFFWSDPVTKIITSYTIYPVRDTECACRSIYDCLKHYKEIPEDLLLITDGNPIYNAAQVFFEINNINFDLQQVIGVQNKDETSKLYRPFKQIEERLNRTYKQNYYGTNGYDKLECANSYMVLFVCFFNFLRKHSSLGFETPVDSGWFEEDMLMQDRWLKLIEISSEYKPA